MNMFGCDGNNTFESSHVMLIQLTAGEHRWGISPLSLIDVRGHKSCEEVPTRSRWLLRLGSAKPPLDTEHIQSAFCAPTGPTRCLTFGQRMRRRSACGTVRLTSSLGRCSADDSSNNMLRFLSVHSERHQVQHVAGVGLCKQGGEETRSSRFDTNNFLKRFEFQPVPSGSTHSEMR